MYIYITITFYVLMIWFGIKYFISTHIIKENPLLLKEKIDKYFCFYDIDWSQLND